MGQVLFMRKGEAHTVPIEPLPAGTIWLYTSDDTFTAPVTGKYSLELHGGGGGGGGGVKYWDFYNNNENTWVCSGGGGGGSGELFEVTLTKGVELPITIGTGGTKGNSHTLDDDSSGYFSFEEAGSDGGATTCGDYSVAGGKGGGVACAGATSSHISAFYYSNATVGTGGAASGSIASKGADGSKYQGNYAVNTSGGQGNKSNTAQTYGDGGMSHASSEPEDGQPGAVIITYLGKE